MTDPIVEAIGKHLEAMTDCPPVAWPDRDFVPNGAAYIEFRLSPGATFDDTIDAIGEIETGIALLTAVAPAGNLGMVATDIERRIRSHFTKGLRLTAGGQTVLINAPANPGTAFTDGAYFRKPVSVRYITEG
jgi:hypothetical protein